MMLQEHNTPSLYEVLTGSFSGDLGLDQIGEKTRERLRIWVNDHFYQKAGVMPGLLLVLDDNYP